jgi:phosphopentomutase
VVKQVGKYEKYEEIEEILKILEPKKKYHLLQTNVNERDDLSQELDILLYQKLIEQLQKEPPSFYQYLKEIEIKIKE